MEVKWKLAICVKGAAGTFFHFVLSRIFFSAPGHFPLHLLNKPTAVHSVFVFPCHNGFVELIKNLYAFLPAQNMLRSGQPCRI
jgi:hypothetical protein